MSDFLENVILPSDGGKIYLTSNFKKSGTVYSNEIMFNKFLKLSISPIHSVTYNKYGSTGVQQYTKILPLSDGTLLATFENYAFRYDIYKSSNGGETWQYFSSISNDSINNGFITEWMPCLFELPVDMGEYKAGTVLLAGTSKSEKDVFKTSTITIHVSQNGGETWKTLCNVDIGGDNKNGIWEPFLIYEEERGRLYCFYSHDGDPEHDQKIVYKYSTDLVNWHGVNDEIGVDVEPKEAVACSDRANRPGMAAVVDIGEGGYLMTYEMVNTKGIRDCQIYYKRTNDLDDWGDVSDYGKPVTDGTNSIGSGGWCAWTPVGGECGMLVAVAKHPVPWHETDKGVPMMLSFDYGKTFTAIDNPIPYDLKPVETHCGYSPCVAFSKDGKTPYYINNPRNKPNTGHDISIVSISLNSIFE